MNKIKFPSNPVNKKRFPNEDYIDNKYWRYDANKPAWNVFLKKIDNSSDVDIDILNSKFTLDELVGSLKDKNIKSLNQLINAIDEKTLSDGIVITSSSDLSSEGSFRENKIIADKDIRLTIKPNTLILMAEMNYSIEGDGNLNIVIVDESKQEIKPDGLNLLGARYIKIFRAPDENNKEIYRIIVIDRKMDKMLSHFFEELANKLK